MRLNLKTVVLLQTLTTAVAVAALIISLLGINGQVNSNTSDIVHLKQTQTMALCSLLLTEAAGKRGAVLQIAHDPPLYHCLKTSIRKYHLHIHLEK